MENVDAVDSMNAKGSANAMGSVGAMGSAQGVRKRKRVSHLRDSILYTSLFTIFGVLVILLPVTYAVTANLLHYNARASTEQLLGQVNNSIGYYISGMTAVSDYLVKDPGIRAYLASEVLGPKSAAAAELGAIAGTRPDFVNLMLFRVDGDFIASREHVGINPYWDYRHSTWYTNAVAAQGRPVLSSSRIENLVAGEYRWVVTLSRALYVGNTLHGVLLIDLNYQSIADICSSLSATQDGYVFIIGADDRLVYHPQQRLIYSGLKSERFDLVRHTATEKPVSVIEGDMVYTSAKAENADWTIVSVFNANWLNQYVPTLLGFYIAVGLLFALFALLISLRSAKRLSDPLLALRASMQQFERGDFDAKADLQVNNEIADLGDGFNIMTARIKKLVENGLLIEEQKRKSEIQALQAQIRPHFLYNTLESIIWMASVGDSAKVIEMTSSLSKLLRASTSNASELISLQTEIEYAANYLKIQKMRYQDKLNDRFEIADDVRSARVVRLIVQPLVENAIYHGIRPLRGPGLIVIAARRDGDRLLIQVSDNGVGFRPGAMPAGQIAPAEPADPNRSHGLGLANVDDRIRLFFGADYGLMVESAPPGGILADSSEADGLRTRITLTLPLIDA